MGRGWLKETANELSSAAVEFAEPVTAHEQSQKEWKHISATVVSHV